jgi:hypothetical protein
MQRTATCESVRVGYARRHVISGLACAILAGCGGGGAADPTPSAQAGPADPQAAAGPGAPSGTPANSPATISGTPATQARSGQAYSFTPVASDPDGDQLTFSVQHQPAWATFSTSTGELSGTPSSAQVATYANIVISVSDGTTSTSLPPFSINVTPPPGASGSAVLTWNAPVVNTDGSPIVSLAGYKIDYGTSAGSLTHSVTIPDPAATSYTLQGLATGTWYFAVADFTSAGTVSALSAVVSKTIQ